MTKGTKLYSILNNKCPKCHKGKFWPWNNPYYTVLAKGGAIYERCDCCNLKYEKETGFWYGSMYVSYGFGVFLFVVSWIATELLLPSGFSMYWQVVIIGAAILVFAPANYYLSRLIWVNMFVKYDKDAKCIEENKVEIVRR